MTRKILSSDGEELTDFTQGVKDPSVIQRIIDVFSDFIQRLDRHGANGHARKSAPPFRERADGTEGKTEKKDLRSQFDINVMPSL